MSFTDLMTIDPIQGHDVIVKATEYTAANNTDGVVTDSAKPFQNAFQDIMFKIVNQTETYLSLTSRIPRYLDGEIIIVWSCTAGTLSFNFVKETFGTDFAAGLKNGRKNRIKRAHRFSLSFAVVPDGTSGESGFANEMLDASAKRKLELTFCRCDTLSFGVKSGKGYAINSWQGTAEGLKRETYTTVDVPIDTISPAK